MNTEEVNESCQEKNYIELTFSAASGIAKLYLDQGYDIVSEDDMFVTVRRKFR